MMTRVHMPAEREGHTVVIRLRQRIGPPLRLYVTTGLLPDGRLGEIFIKADKENWSALAQGGLIYVNPPYGDGIGEWTSRCRQAALAGASVHATVRVGTPGSMALCGELVMTIAEWKTFESVLVFAAQLRPDFSLILEGVDG
jgi:hypothetical protein